MNKLQLSNLTLLLKAPSKDIVVSLCNEVFLQRDVITWPDAVVTNTCDKLSINDNEAKLLLGDMKALVKQTVFIAASDRSDVAALFPENFHKNLQELLVTILVQRLPHWKQHIANNLVFLPKLVEFNWRVDVKSSSDSLSRMSVPTCLLQLQVQEPLQQYGVLPATSTVNVELSRQTLDTMLYGLAKIRDQLSSVANSQ